LSLAEPCEVISYHRSGLSCPDHRSTYYTLLLVKGASYSFMLQFTLY